MPQANPFDQFDGQAQPVPVQQLQPIIGTKSPEERAREQREEERDVERLGVTVRGEERGIEETSFNQIGSLRKEFNVEPLVREFRGVESATRQIVGLAQDETSTPGPRDIALIISYMKALDPGSVVREGEFATAENAGGVPESVRNYYNRVVEGGRLSPELRREFADTAIGIYNTRRQQYDNFANTYRGLLEDQGADPDRQGVRLSEEIGFGSPEAAGGGIVPVQKGESAEVGAGIRGREIEGPAGTVTESGVVEPDIRFGFPQGTKVELGLDRVGEDDVWDRAQWLQKEFGLEPNEELIIGAFWNANSGNQNLTEENVRQWYENKGYRQPSAEDISAGIEHAKAGGQFSQTFDERAAEKLYTEALDKALEQMGEDPESYLGTITGSGAAGATAYFDDEMIGALYALGAAASGDNAFDAYQVYRDLVRRKRERGEAENPNLALGSEIAGGLMTGGARLATKAGQTGVKAAAKEGTAWAALAGAGQGEGLGGSAINAAVAAPFGMGLGAAGEKVLSPVLGKLAPRAAQGADEAAPVVQEMTEEAATEVGTVAREAIGRGKRARNAQERLAIMAQVDPEAKAAAERLGVELPIDVLSDDVRLSTTTGLARSQIGSDAQTNWQQTVGNAIRQSDEVMAEIGATKDLAQVSADVKARLERNITNLQSEGDALRSQVDDAINVRDRLDATNLQSVLGDLIQDMGGIDEAKKAFTAEERKLLAMLGEGEKALQPTYARLNQIRDQIGRALNKNSGPWVDAPTANLKAYYGALARDQLAYVEQVGGEELASTMRASNEMFSRMYAGREAMQSIYGRNLERDLGPLINRAVKGAAKGDAQALRQLLEPIPEDMRSQVLLSGLLTQAQRASSNGGFSFANFSKLYRGLRENAPIYSQIAREIGPERAQILQDLYAVSRRVADAENKIVRTGASTQPLINALNAESLVQKVMEGTARRAAVTGGSAMAGGVVGGPMGAAVAGGVSDAMQEALSKSGSSRLDRLHGVLSSEAFRNMVEKVSTNGATQADINRLSNDKGFRNWALGTLRLKTEEQRRNWINTAIRIGTGQATAEEPNGMETPR